MGVAVLHCDHVLRIRSRAVDEVGDAAVRRGRVLYSRARVSYQHYGCSERGQSAGCSERGCTHKVEAIEEVASAAVFGERVARGPLDAGSSSAMDAGVFVRRQGEGENEGEELKGEH